MSDSVITADCQDDYLADYLFEVNGYLIIKGAVARPDLDAMNQWVDQHWDLAQGQRRGPDSQGTWIGHVETHTYSGADGVNFQNIVEGGAVFERLLTHPSWYRHIQRWINPTNGVSLHECLLNLRGAGGYIGIHCGGHLPITYMTFRQANTGEWMVGQINVITALQDIGPGDGPTTLIPGSHKATIPHPRLTGDTGSKVYRSDQAAGTAVGMRELYLEAGDTLLFTDTITHGSAERRNPGHRRMILYRYSPRWVRSRFNYQPSPELLARLAPEARAILDPIPTRRAPVAPATQ
jgi:ribosomal protein L21E